MPILDNLILTASYGGRDDHLIGMIDGLHGENLRSAKVVFSEAEAEMLGLEIDHDDSTRRKTVDCVTKILPC